MDPYPIRERENGLFADPIYPHVQHQLHTVKVIPIYGEDAKIFPSWGGRNSVRLCALFDPLTLEIHILFCESHTRTSDPGNKNKQLPEKVVISPSFFIPIGDEGAFHITLQRQRDVEDKILGFYQKQCPIGQESLAAKVAGDFHAALMDLKNCNEDYPSLQLCFRNEGDKMRFFKLWSVAFGRRPDKKYPGESQLHRGIAYHLESPDTVKLSSRSTPVSLQSPRNFKDLISPSLVYERTQLVTQLRSLFEERALEDLAYHLHGDGSAKSPFIWEIFIPYSKLKGCKLPEYKAIKWQARVMSLGDSSHESVELAVHDHSIRMLREPLLPAKARKQHYKSLIQESKLSEWLKNNEEEKYWCLKLIAPEHFSKLEPSKKINLILIPETFQLDQIILSTLDFADGSSPSFNPAEHITIQEIFLGHRLGRLLPVEVSQRINPTPTSYLLPEQANIYRHVLKHDFTLVDGAPGTGKSRVTAEIISDLILWGKKVFIMATSEASLDVLASNVLSILPKHCRLSESVARVYSYPESWSRDGPQKEPTWNNEPILQRVSVGIHHLSAKNSRREMDRITRANAIFMTTATVLNCYKGSGISRRIFDLIVIDGAHTINEGLALRFTTLPFSNSFRWLIIGCSKGIEPPYLIDDFRKMEICGSWFKRLLRHPEFRLNPLRLTKQMRCRKALYQPINDVYFNNAVTTSLDVPDGPGDSVLCMGFVNTSSICKPKVVSYDEELMEMEKYQGEQAVLFDVLNKITQFSPSASVVLLSYCKSHEVLVSTELSNRRKIGKPISRMTFVSTVQGFADREADYAVVHLPLWKGSYEEYAEHGKFVTAMTRARRGVYVVGNLQELKKYEKIRGSWDKNPWNVWLVWLKNSDCGAIFNNIADFDLQAQPNLMPSAKEVEE